MTRVNLVAVLTCEKGVSETQVSEAAEQLPAASSPNRLGDCAVELHFVGSDLTSVPAIDDVDVNILPATGRRKSLLLADMDSTIIPVECIDELADFVGKKDEVSAVTERAMRGELDFEDALHSRVATLKGVTRAEIDRCRIERVHLNPGARALVTTMNANGAFTALVSGGFTVFTEMVAAEAGFQMNRANELLFDGDALSGRVAMPICGADTKLTTMQEILARKGWQTADVIAVGDGANDAPMISNADLGVAYRAKPMLRELAKARLDHSDLTALLSLQGYAETEFVTD